jgi:hypothetical protein
MLIKAADVLGRAVSGACGCIYLLGALWWASTLSGSFILWFQLGVGTAFVYIAATPNRTGSTSLGQPVLVLAVLLAVANAVWSGYRLSTASASAAEFALSATAAAAALTTFLARSRQHVDSNP